ncbi:hypothetical protein BKI52_43475 [marine bacterium AO1-C]|nr:hypothetical protein BKI52_43475 [marine bacterium AO1-C]
MIYMIRSLKSVQFGDDRITFKYILTGKRVAILYSDIKGLMYHFNHEEDYRYKWKKIELKTYKGKSYDFRKTFFLNFLSLEKELVSRFSILEKTSQEPLISSFNIEYIHQENRSFDLSKAKEDFWFSLLAGLFFVGLGGLTFFNRSFDINLEGARIDYGAVVMGSFLLYRATHNAVFLKQRKKWKPEESVPKN